MPDQTFRKRPTWDADLRAYLNACRRMHFEWGTWDCALCAAGAVEAMTGTDPAANLRGRYTDAATGKQLINQLGYLDHIDMAAALFDTVKNKALAAWGDIAAVPTNAGLALGIVGGPVIFAPRLRGLGTLQLTDAKRVFRIP